MTRPLAVVTGASSGIGRAIALQLAATGTAVALLARDAKRLAAVAEAIVSGGGEARRYRLDMTDDDALREVASDLASQPITSLIHSAGTVELGPVATASVSLLDAQYRLNLRAPFLLTQLLLGSLRDSRGHVVFINSSAGLQAKPDWSQYAATKFGLRALADSLRQEVADAGVRVTTVYPGRTATPMQEKVRRLEGQDYTRETYVRSDDVARQVVSLLTTEPPSLVTELTIKPG